jgi:1-acyl-sn-glycerol-3-phosphate acyltransferase
MVLIKNLFFYLIVILFTIIFFSIFVIVLLFIRIFTSKRIAQKTLRFLIVCYGRIIIYGFIRILVNVKFIDTSADKKPTYPCVYVVNHRSASDAFLMGVLPGEFVQIVNLWPFKIPILGICAHLAGYLSVRSMPFDDFSDECKTLFSQNVSIIGFPEGTRSLSSKMGQFHSTLFRVAKENKLSIVPLCILGNKDKPKRNSLIINPGNVEIHNLSAINYDEYENLDSFELKNHVRNIMQTFIDNNKNRLE